MRVGIRKATRFTLATAIFVGYLLAEVWLFKDSGFSFSDALLLDVPLTVVAIGVFAAVYAVTGGIGNNTPDSN